MTEPFLILVSEGDFYEKSNSEPLVVRSRILPRGERCIVKWKDFPVLFNCYVMKTDATVSIFWMVVSYVIFAILSFLSFESLSALYGRLKFIEFIPVVGSIDNGAVFDVLKAKVHFCLYVLFFPIIVFSYVCVPKGIFIRKAVGANRVVLFAFVMPLVSIVIFFSPVNSGSIGRFLSSFYAGFSFLSALIVILWSMTFCGLLEIIGVINSREGD